MCLETDINLKILIFQLKIKNSKAEIIIWINIAK